MAGGSYSKFCKALKQFERAADSFAFLGTQHPDDHDAIREEYNNAKETLKRLFKEQSKKDENQ